jgi:formylglycine-generating enzyme required for sulfatase activity
MGSKEDNKLASNYEYPQHPLELPEYWIGRFPVTNEQYNAFIQAQKAQHPVRGWQHKKDHPMVNVSWDDVIAHCKWLNDRYRADLPKNLVFRLPTEAEWEKAARGEYANEWPWGNEFDAAKCNSSEGEADSTTPVGAYAPQGDSPYGAADMAGNVWKWTHSLFKEYPYDTKDGREKEDNRCYRVLRGGAFESSYRVVRAVCRWNLSNNRARSLGYRVGVLPTFQLCSLIL